MEASGLKNYNILEVKKKIEDCFIQFGAQQIEISNGSYWTYNSYYFGVDIIPFHTKPFFVIEFADTLEDATNNCFEDLDPFPCDLDEVEFLNEVNSFLYGLV